MGLLLFLGVILVLVALPIGFAIRNPIVNVVDDLTTTTPYEAVDSQVAKLLGDMRGYELRIVAPGTYTLSYRRSPAWAMVLGLLTFPIGILIILFARETLTLTFSITSTGSGTRLLVLGRVHEKLARATGTAVEARVQRSRASSAGELQPDIPE